MIDFVESYLASWNVPFIRLPNEAGDKAALYATIGPQDRGGVVLSGHTDVVPVKGQSWTSDPFTLRVEDGKAFGRGAVDMKAFVRNHAGARSRVSGRRSQDADPHHAFV